MVNSVGSRSRTSKLFPSSARSFCHCFETDMLLHSFTGEEGVGQPRDAQLLRPPVHQLHAHRLGGDSVGRGDADRRPLHGAVLAGQRPSGRDDPVHHRQVQKSRLYFWTVVYLTLARNVGETCNERVF